MLLRLQRWLLVLIGALLILGPAIPVFVSPRALPDLVSNPPANFPSFTQRVDDVAATYVGAGGAFVEAAQRLRFLGDVVSALPAVEGEDGWLFLNSEKLKNRKAGIRVNNASVQAFLRRAERLDAEQKARGGRFIVAPAPDKATIYPEFAPYAAGSAATDSLDVFFTEAEARGIAHVDLRPTLLRERERGPLYGPVDTHWNRLAALIAYNAIVEKLGADRAAIEVADHFSGYRTVETEGDLTRILQSGPREILVPLVAADLYDAARFVRTESLGPHALPEGAYLLSRTESGGQSEDGRAVLIFGDSFSNGLLTPLFAGKFDRVMWVHWLQEPLDPALMQAFNPDIVVLEFVERFLE